MAARLLDTCRYTLPARSVVTKSFLTRAEGEFTLFSLSFLLDSSVLVINIIIIIIIGSWTDE